MERLHSSHELWGALPFGQDGSNAWSAGSVKGLGEVYEEQVQVFTLFNAFFLQLSYGKGHVHNAFASSETTLTFRDHVVY